MRPWLDVRRDWRRPSVDEVYFLYWCRKSSFGMLHPRPKAEAISAFYDLPDYYTHQNGAADSGQSATRFWDRVLLHLAWLAGRDVEVSPDYWRTLLGEGPRHCCEIGCGNGSTLHDWVQLGYEAVGIEPDPKARDVATSGGMRVHPGTAEDLPPAVLGQKFDAVAMIHVLEHCLHPVAALDNALKILKPGGWLVVEVPNNDCLGARMSGPTWPWLDVPRHLNFFTARSLDIACRVVGFAPERVEYRGYCRQYSPAWAKNERTVARELAQGKASAYASLNSEGIPKKYWAQLLLTALAPARLKYDSVRVVARKPS